MPFRADAETAPQPSMIFPLHFITGYAAMLSSGGKTRFPAAALREGKPIMFRAILVISCLILTVPSAPEVTAADAGSTGRVTADFVRLRTGPGTSFTSVGNASRGQKIPILDEKNGWYRTNYPAEGTCWVPRQLVKAAPGAAPKTGIVTGSLLVRAGGVRGETVAVLKEDDEVSILGETGGWLRIAPPSEAQAWIFGRFVEKIEEGSPAPAGTEEKAETPSAAETPGAASGPETNNPRETFAEAEKIYRAEMQKIKEGKPADLLVPGKMFIRVANDYFCDEETRRTARARIVSISGDVPPDARKTLADYDAEVLKAEIERVKILYEKEMSRRPAPLTVDKSLQLR
jgi:uncharacterized protein YraI